jgi:hypothetical protein
MTGDSTNRRLLAAIFCDNCLFVESRLFKLCNTREI